MTQFCSICFNQGWELVSVQISHVSALLIFSLQLIKYARDLWPLLTPGKMPDQGQEQVIGWISTFSFCPTLKEGFGWVQSTTVQEFSIQFSISISISCFSISCFSISCFSISCFSISCFSTCPLQVVTETINSKDQTTEVTWGHPRPDHRGHMRAPKTRPQRSHGGTQDQTTEVTWEHSRPDHRGHMGAPNIGIGFCLSREDTLEAKRTQ